MILVNGLKARFAVIALLVFAILSFLFLGPYDVTPGHISPKATTGKSLGHTSEAVLTGHAIAPKLGNATAKYVLPAFARTSRG
jgi:FAD-linked sulfhydryl oxidase